MTNRADIRNKVRRELNDIAVGNYLYSDQLLNDYFLDAMDDWSGQNPPLKSTTIAPVNGQSLYPLAVNLQNISSVEQPDGIPLPRVNTDQAATPEGWQAYQQGWDYQAWKTLVLRYPSVTGDPTITVRYYGYYLAPTDDITVLDIETADEHAIVWFICMRALNWLETQREQRGDKRGVPRFREYSNRYKDMAKAANRRKGIRVSRLKDVK
jgi:hypothetical protein